MKAARRDHNASSSRTSHFVSTSSTDTASSTSPFKIAVLDTYSVALDLDSRLTPFDTPVVARE
jgi:hypothetical protein